MMRHIIKKQIIELSLDKRLNYFHVQQQVSDRYWNEIVPLLEKSFDSISGEDKVIEIDRLEVDLGVITEKELRSREFITEVKKRIDETITATVDPQSSRYSARPRDRKRGAFDHWLYYMDHGYLAWNSDRPGDRWRSDVLETLKKDNDSRLALRKKIIENTDFLNRMVNLHDNDFLSAITEILSSVRQESLSGLIGELIKLEKYLVKKKIIPGRVGDETLRNELWHKALRLYVMDKSGQSVKKDLIVSFISEKKSVIRIPPKAAESFPQVIPVLTEFMAEIRKQQNKEEKRIEKARDDIRSSNYEETGNVSEQITGSDVKVPDEDGIFVVNAGTVLIHPFLKRFFDRTGITKDNSFIDEGARIKGIYLLHYIATGRTGAEEFELTLAKVLCGMPVELPVEQIKKLDQKLIHEAGQLIEAVLAQWSILKNTSGDGLREGFLQRPGKLFTKNGNIYLTVAKSSIDVLLDHLPWNLGMIMLPWMKDILWVEWR